MRVFFLFLFDRYLFLLNFNFGFPTGPPDDDRGTRTRRKRVAVAPTTTETRHAAVRVPNRDSYQSGRAAGAWCDDTARGKSEPARPPTTGAELPGIFRPPVKHPFHPIPSPS